jgi:hypothetical protein
MTTGLSIFQLLLAAIALVYIAAGTVRFFSGAYRQTFIRFMMSVVLWSAVLVFSLFPDLSHFVSLRLGFGDNLYTLIFIGFVLVFIALFKLLNAVERLEQSITGIVRNEALSRLPAPPTLTKAAADAAVTQTEER